MASASYLKKWIVLGVVIGAVAGLGAIVFYEALVFSTHFFLGVLAGYQVPTPVGEGRPGGLLPRRPARGHSPSSPVSAHSSGALLVFRLAPEAEGHGTDAAISAVHHNPRGVRFRAVIVKIVASALTIGSGGSGGREGPTGQISAGFGSLLARMLDLEPADGRIAVATGIGSGIGAIFGAPLGGAVLASEILYRDDFEPAALLRLHRLGRQLRGLRRGRGIHTAVRLRRDLPLHRPGPVDLVRPHRHVGRPGRTPLCQGLLRLGRPVPPTPLAPLGQPGHRWAHGRCHRHRHPRGPRHRLRLGADSPRPRRCSSIPLWIVLIVPFARILATGLSIGSGGSGGIFGPGMVIGAFLGASVWRLFDPVFPSMGHDPAPYVIVGMMSCFGGISRAPLAVMLMVAEMTGSLSILTPAMVAVGISWLIVRRNDDTIYRSQLKNRADAPAQRLLAGLPLLAAIPVTRAMAEPRLVVSAVSSADSARRALDQKGLNGAPVVDEAGRLEGTIARSRLANPATGNWPAGDLSTPGLRPSRIRAGSTWRSRASPPHRSRGSLCSTMSVGSWGHCRSPTSCVPIAKNSSRVPNGSVSSVPRLAPLR